MFQSRKDRVVGLRGRTLVFYGTKRKEYIFPKLHIFDDIITKLQIKPLLHKNYTFYFDCITKL
jgi:hypothetical protein